jgi:hypothetical protein
MVFRFFYYKSFVLFSFIKPYTLYFFLDKKVPKNQDYACFAQKTSAQKAKTPKLAALRLKQWVFFNAFLSCFLAHQSRSILWLLIISEQFDIIFSLYEPFDYVKGTYRGYYKRNIHCSLRKLY